MNGIDIQLASKRAELLSHLLILYPFLLYTLGLNKGANWLKLIKYKIQNYIKKIMFAMNVFKITSSRLNELSLTDWH